MGEEKNTVNLQQTGTADEASAGTKTANGTAEGDAAAKRFSETEERTEITPEHPEWVSAAELADNLEEETWSDRHDNDEKEEDPDAEEWAAMKPNYEEEIIAIIRSNASPRVMRERLEDYHDNDIEEILDQLTSPERKKFFRIMPVDLLSGIFEYMEEDEAGIYLTEMDMLKASQILCELDADTAVAFLRKIPKDKRASMIDLMDSESRRDIALIASFDEDEIGSRMSTNYIKIREHLTVKEAMTSLVEQAADNDNISTIFVVDEYGIFYGAIDLKELIIARHENGKHLDNLIATSFPYVYGHENIDDCIEKLKDYSENSIPVLANDNRLLGVITSQNIVEVVDEVMGEDYAKLAGLLAEEDLQEPVLESLKKRFPWLAVLLVLGMLVSSVVTIFEQVVAQLTLIMAFQSLILGMSGNVGTQSLAVTVRVLMDESLTGKQRLELLFKEVRVGFCNGLLLGSISFVFIGLFIMLIKGKAALFSFAISGCIGVSLVLAMLISSATGTLIPMFFHRMKIDPAVASGPLITTVNDLVAVVTYYGMSWILLINILHLAG